MKRYGFLFFLFPLLFFSCLNKAEVREEKIKKEQTLSDVDLPKEKLRKFNSSFSVTNAEKKNNSEFYSVEYTFSFTVSFPEEKVFLEYQLFDTDDILLTDGKIGENKLQSTFSESIPVTSYFDYDSIKFKITCKNKDKEVLETFEGECRNAYYPKELNFDIQSVNSDFINNERNVSLVFACYAETTDDTVLEKVRVIPPSKDFYWDIIPDALDDNVYKIISNIKDSTHNDYIECGEYHVQFFLGKNGIIQSSCFLKDIYGNRNGPNYGAPTVTVLSEDFNTIEWELQELPYLTEMEFLLYEKNDKEEFVASYLLPELGKSCAKKTLFQQLQKKKLRSDKIKFNKKYLYRIRLTYQNPDIFDEKRGIKYISTSPFYEITFYGFNLF